MIRSTYPPRSVPAVDLMRRPGQRTPVKPHEAIRASHQAGLGQEAYALSHTVMTRLAAFGDNVKAIGGVLVGSAVQGRRDLFEEAAADLRCIAMARGKTSAAAALIVRDAKTAASSIGVTVHLADFRRCERALDEAGAADALEKAKTCARWGELRDSGFGFTPLSQLRPPVPLMPW